MSHTVTESALSKITIAGVGTTMTGAGAAKVQQILGYTVDEWTVYLGMGGFLVALFAGVMGVVIRYLDYKDNKMHRQHQRYK
jgi:hypothetical protein